MFYLATSKVGCKLRSPFEDTHITGETFRTPFSAPLLLFRNLNWIKAPCMSLYNTVFYATLLMVKFSVKGGTVVWTNIFSSEL